MVPLFLISDLIVDFSFLLLYFFDVRLHIVNLFVDDLTLQRVVIDSGGVLLKRSQ